MRYGKLCHEFHPAGADRPSEVFSVTKTLGAVVTGMVAHQTADLPRTGRKTGPLAVEDRVDHWIDEFSFHPDARIGHVLAMVAHNDDLGFGRKRFQYDIDGTVQINRLSDVLNAALAQDPGRFGPDLDAFTQRFLFDPLGMDRSRWSRGASDKNFAVSWEATVREMARLGLLLLRGGAWGGERLLSEEWVYAMTHPAFEDASHGYGHLTWLATRTRNPLFGDCVPAPIWRDHPHGLSESPDCGYLRHSCEQAYDAGVWAALGLFGQIIMGHPGLDLVLVAKDVGPIAAGGVWEIARPALIARDPRYAGDEAAFCRDYAASDYAPDLR